MGIYRAFVLFFSSILPLGIFSQCLNADFESGNFTGWQGTTGTCCPILLPNNGIIAGRQTIVGPGFDGNTCGGLSRVYAGNFAARLGNANIGAEAEGLSYTFVVSPTGSLIRYAYAVIFENPNHGPANQPRFSSRVSLSDGSTIPCTEYTVNADSNLIGWQSCPTIDNNGDLIDIVWRNWSEVTVDLSAYIGQTVTLEFETGDCTLGGHFGYAYLDAIYCMDNNIVVDYCEGDTISTLTAPDGFSSYSWENGDTTQSVTINPNVWDSIYCVVTTTTGCELTLISDVDITNIESSFTYEGQCEGIFEFTNTSTSTQGITSHYWNFGDGGFSDIENPTHIFTPGHWVASLTTTSVQGCVDVSVQEIDVYPYPTADFISNDVCLGDESNFTNLSTVIPGYGLNYLWDLIETTSSIQSPSYTYLNSGSYNVNLIITTQGSICGDTITKTINIRENPISNFSTSNNCEGDSSLFINNSNLPTWSTNQFIWTFGDESTSTSFLDSVWHFYSEYGIYPVSLQILSSDGLIICESTYIDEIIIHPNPVANFEVANDCINSNIQFTNLSTISTGQISSYNWNLGNGYSDEENPLSIYDQPGSFLIELSILSDFGCVDSTQNILEIYPLSDVSFSLSEESGCPPLTISFNDNSTNDVSTWVWNFGDGNFSFDQNPIHTYDISGSYVVTLQVTTSDNCSSSNTSPIEITVYPNPIAGFNISPTHLSEFDPQVHIQNTSTGASSYNWNFGDGSFSFESNPLIHVFNSAGNYQITLNVENEFGCIDMMFTTVDIDPVYTFYIPNSFTPDGDGNNEIFFGSGIGYTDITMRIFNRWGELIFDETSNNGHSDIKPYWDGTSMNIDCQIDVYIYQFLVTDIFGETHMYNGKVTLIR